MNEQELEDVRWALRLLAHDQQEFDQAWVDFVIAALELEFLSGEGVGQ